MIKTGQILMKKAKIHGKSSKSTNSGFFFMKIWFNVEKWGGNEKGSNNEEKTQKG
jgi:hypothetical protein